MRLVVVPNKYWTLGTASEATRWLIEEKLKWSDDDIRNNLTADTFEDNALGGMLQQAFDDSPYKAIDTAYPKRFKPWELKNVPIGYWTKETGIEATKWLFEEKLEWTHTEVRTKASVQIFKEHSLHSMLRILFNDSPEKAIEATYPM